MPPIEPHKVKAWIGTVAEQYDKSIGELYYYFCSDDKLLEINRKAFEAGRAYALNK